MRLVSRSLILLLPSILLLPNTLLGEEIGEKENTYSPFPGWFTSLKVAGDSQLDAGLNDGGDYNRNRLSAQISQSYFWDPKNSASVSLGYQQLDYDFSGGNSTTLAGSTPWDKIDILTISTPMRTNLNEHWSGFLLPYVRFSGESNADFSDAITSGIIAAASYRLNQHLSLGTGLAVSSQLEDSVSVFPLLLVNWAINDQLALNLGSNRDTNQGPGLSLSYRVNKKWLYTFGGYYEKSRFRLDKNGNIAGGVGEERAFPILVSATYQMNPGMKFMFVTGTKLGSQLRVEDSDGDKLFSESADPSLTAGISIAIRL